MKTIKVEDAVGTVLCQDICRIIKDDVKDTPFRKGHIVTEEDIPVLLSLGKEHLYVFEKDESMLHENEAAEVLCSITKNEYMSQSEIREGKIELRAEVDGVFTIDIDKLDEINSIDEIMIATTNNLIPVKKGEKLAGMRVIPLVIKKDKMDACVKVAGGEPILKLWPYRSLKAGIVTTGSEVYKGRIKDTFTPVIIDKLKAYGCEVCGHEICDDDQEMITNAILKLKNEGAQMIITTGGMSVDPDDRTPSAIRKSGCNVISYGAPVLPGAMFLLGYFEDGTPVMGLPGCVMFAKTTVFDLMLPRIVAGIPVTKKDIARLGNGGLCRSCSECHYPNCGFGKGV